MGDEGDDVIEADVGQIFGGIGNDTITVNIGDVSGEDGDDIIIINNSSSTFYNQNVAKGGAGNDTIIAQNGNATLDGGEGTDKLIGGKGNNTFIVDEFDTYIEEIEDLAGGYDTIHIASDFDLSQNNFEAVTLLGTDNYNAIGDKFDNIIIGNVGNNRLVGALGDDTLIGNEGNDYLDGGIGSDIMEGGDGDDYYVLDNELDSVSENGTGIDTIEQHTDRRFYHFDELGNAIKTDSYSQLQQNIENLILKGQAKTAFGNELDNTITLNKQNNFINALSGNDTIIYQKGGGQDTIVSTDSTAATDTLIIQGYDLNNAILSRLDSTLGSSNNTLQIHFVGSNDIITLLDYYAPVTTDGTHTIDNKIDRIIFQNNGKETVLTQAQLESATVSQHNNQAPTVANAIADQTVSFGTAFNYKIPTTTFKDPEGDTLSYTAILEDGSALPTWLVFNPTTGTFSGTVPQNSDPINIKITATDTFKNSVSDIFTINFTIPSLTINGTNYADTLTGKEGDDILNGLAGNDTLIGKAGNDKLDGGIGADKLIGGTGNDTYIIDNARDTITENPNEGVDTVQSNITYTLGNNLENLALLGTVTIDGTGNALDNVIVGNKANNTLTGGAGNDTLDGGLGADRLIGGAGDDTYIIDNIGDVITENTNQGTDTIKSSITYTLGNNLENLTLTGNATINGIGNTLNNTINGNNANNIISGGAGDDIYVYLANQGIDSIDNIGGGIDTINFANINDSQLSYHKDGNDLVILVDKDLAQQLRVKNQFTTTTDNAIDNITTQNGMIITKTMIASHLTALPTKIDMSGNNTLKDTSGNDTLVGEAGNDNYYHTGGKDVIIDTSGIDSLIFSNGITFNQVGSGLMQSGYDLILRVNNDSNNEVVLTNFFKDTNSIIETISFETDGSISAQQIYSLFGKAMPKPDTPISTAPAIQGNANDNDLIGKSTDDVIQGLAGNDRLQGLLGNDTLEGGDGNDILVGGDGNDILAGGIGNDLYYFKAGFGQDTIINTGGGIDNIYFDNLTFNQLSQGLIKSGDDLTLKVSDSTDQLTIKNFFLGSDNASVNISFASGDSLTSNQIFAAYGRTNPNPSEHTTGNYQSSLLIMLNLMSDYNKSSPSANESAVL